MVSGIFQVKKRTTGLLVTCPTAKFCICWLDKGILQFAMDIEVVIEVVIVKHMSFQPIQASKSAAWRGMYFWSKSSTLSCWSSGLTQLCWSRLGTWNVVHSYAYRTSQWTSFSNHLVRRAAYMVAHRRPLKSNIKGMIGFMRLAERDRQIVGMVEYCGRSPIG